ncbi:PREDICTED: putative pentatricopeptide repeat-containing protein At1g53330 [Camelina sativa]|uniref:Pentatricopeptide repeat-containing protein At1g53330 n=1 Tax=Camelina sativa TaxID=90675 RepID=A0ABM0VWS9_CAMSA|nr:PREDICTED: putative pentatricopeptide repeat-containing protein At1g53330 [Camelina sativa]XP_010462216.1 PREDICTED: putative pentatricopeptide repeat-containing protein At1g53330 [Camelina sativa]
MTAVKSVSSSFRLASLLRRENDPSAAVKLFRNPDPESTNPKRPFRYSLLCYDLIITKLGGSKMFEELDQVLLQLKADTRIVPTEILFCNVINFFGRGRLPSRALHVFDEMPQYRCQRSVKSVNSLLNALLKCGEFEKMRDLLSGVGEFGKPDACTYNILINGCSQSGCLDDALKLFDEMVKRKVKPTGVTFGTMIHGFCKNSRVKEALKMKQDMLKVYGVRPTVHIYASLIKAVCRIGELSFAFKLKDEAYEGKVKVDSAIYSTLISSLIKAGRSSEVSRILDEMSEKGCKPDTVTYNVLINGFCVENDYESAYRVLDDMVGKGLKLDVISYNMILGVLFRIRKWEEATYLFEDMPRRGCSPDTLSYRIVFDGLCEGLQFEEAAVILDEMLFKGYKPRRDRLERFLQKLCEIGKLEILSKVISSLHKGNAAEDANLWSVMIPTMFKVPAKSGSINLLLNKITEDGPLSAMPQC